MLDLEWHRTGHPLAALIVQSIPILGMNQSGAEVRCHQLVHSESGILQQGPVGVEEGSVRLPDDNELGYGVDDAPQLLLVLPELRLGPLEVFDIGIGAVPPDDVALF